ncbi:MAG TPA: ABC transporter permease [Candidatus Deferrimicrobiaceae bacterium]
MSSALAHLVATRIRETLRQPEAIFWTFLFPVLMSVALGVAFRSDRPDPAAVIVAEGPGADRLETGLRGDNAVAVERLAREEADARLRSGKAAVVVVPGDPLTYRFDPTRPESRLARARVEAALQRAAGRTDPLPVREEPVTEPGSRYIDFLVPGLLGMNLMGGGLWGIGWTIVEMRIRKLLKLLLTTPMRRRDFLLSHVLVRVAFVPLEVVPLLVLARLLFDVRVTGSWASLGLVSLLGAVSFAGLGTLVASRARTTGAISGLINLCTLPMFVLSGVFFSTTRFPESLQPWIRALPLTALIDALRALMVEGAPLASLGAPLAVLALWGALSFAVALRVFRWA